MRDIDINDYKGGESGSTLASMGFGFVQYFRAADAQKALKQLQGELLDGHSLELKLSQRETRNGADPKRKSVEYLEQGYSTKILVRNIAFQATKKELEELFGAFGEIRSIRTDP